MTGGPVVDVSGRNWGQMNNAMTAQRIADLLKVMREPPPGVVLLPHHFDSMLRSVNRERLLAAKAAAAAVNEQRRKDRLQGNVQPDYVPATGLRWGDIPLVRGRPYSRPRSPKVLR